MFENLIESSPDSGKPIVDSTSTNVAAAATLPITLVWGVILKLPKIDPTVEVSLFSTKSRSIWKYAPSSVTIRSVATTEPDAVIFPSLSSWKIFFVRDPLKYFDVISICPKLGNALSLRTFLYWASEGAKRYSCGFMTPTSSL